jgi:hypothetical protein
VFGMNSEGFKVEDPTRDPHSFREAEWSDNLDLFSRHGIWPRYWGPRPGEIGCLVPPHLLAQSDPSSATSPADSEQVTG